MHTNFVFDARVLKLKLRKSSFQPNCQKSSGRQRIFHFKFWSRFQSVFLQVSFNLSHSHSTKGVRCIPIETSIRSSCCSVGLVLVSFYWPCASFCAISGCEESCKELYKKKRKERKSVQKKGKRKK